MLEIAFRPDPNLDEPVYAQLARYLRELLAAGRLLPGERLPASRELARQLAVSRNTVNHSYQALLDEGLLTSHVGQGTFVAARSHGSARSGVGEADAANRPRPFVWEGLFSTRSQRSWPPPRPPASPRPLVHDFRGGRVDPSLLPGAELRRVWSRVMRQRLSEIASPGSPQGYGPLREEISLVLVARGVQCEPADILVVNGAQQALDLVTRVLVDPDDLVIVEQPGYFGALQVLRGCGAQLAGVAVDEHGLRTDDVARVLRSRRAKLIYTTPAVQSPTGVTLSPERRSALLGLSDEYQVPILEDDYDSELRYDGPTQPALKTQDSNGRVLYVGTFSKALFPGLRIGYLVAPRPLLQRVTVAKVFGDMGCDAVSQIALTEMLATGALERHLRRVRKALAERRSALAAALHEALPEDAHFRIPAGGPTLWIELPDRIDPVALRAAAIARGVAIESGESYRLDGGGSHFLSLSFANQNPDDLRAGAAILCEEIVRCAGQSSG